MTLRQWSPLAVVGLIVVVAAWVGNGVRTPHSYITETIQTPIGPVCTHLNTPYSGRECFASEGFRVADVVAETLVVHLKGGQVKRIAVPSQSDAIFLTESAISTFLLRHYDGTNQAKASSLRAFMN